MEVKTKATLESVIAAADAILASGGRVSVRNVMDRLGGGSPNSITAHLRTWREQKPLIEQRKAIVIDERIAALIAEQVEKAATLARAEAEEERASAVADYELVASTGRDLERECEQLREQIAAATQRAQHDAGAIEQLRAEASTAKTEAAEAINKAQAEAQTERAKNDSLAQQLGAAQAELKLLQARAAALETKLDEAQAEAGRAQRAAAVSDARLAEGEKREKDLAARLAAAEAQAKATAEQLAQAQAQAAGLQAAAARAQQMEHELAESRAQQRELLAMLKPAEQKAEQAKK